MLTYSVMRGSPRKQKLCRKLGLFMFQAQMLLVVLAVCSPQRLCSAAIVAESFVKPVPEAEDYSIAFGDVVQLVHLNTSRFLYSFPGSTTHEGGSRQQPVVGGTIRDSSTHWSVMPFDKQLGEVYGQAVGSNRVRLEHVNTNRNLHSHKGYVAPVSSSHNEVTVFPGQANDVNNAWTVQHVGDGIPRLHSRILIRHVETSVVLASGFARVHENSTYGYQEVSGGPGGMEDSAWVAIPVSVGCTRDLRCPSLAPSKQPSEDVARWLNFEQFMRNDINKDPLNGPKEINLFCPQDPDIQVSDLDSDLHSKGYCLSLNINAPFLESKLLLRCAE